jgi:4-aminobutyrate aminotransferase-like enzyme/Ser/Thr protein kinase RdoA (MazF antagonist)
MSLLGHTPRFSIAEATSLAEELYGLRAMATPLPSERDQNFLLETESGEKFVLKIANSLEDRALLDAQHAAMTHIAQQISLCPRVVPALSGETIATVESSTGAKNFVRLFTYLPGVPLAEVHPHSPELLRDLGRKIGQLDRALATFDHAAVHRNFHWDLVSGLNVIHEYGALITDAGLRDLIYKFASNCERDLAPSLPRLGTSVIHNDANDYNILVGGSDGNQHVTGLIDFGDMVYSFTVGDLAVAIAYAILEKPHPLAAAAQLVEGYHAEYPLTEGEIDALFGLVCLRLCMSVCLAAQQQPQRPDDDYLSISQRAIRSTLPKLMALDARFAVAAFRDVCGLAPSYGTASGSEPVVSKSFLQGATTTRSLPLAVPPDGSKTRAETLAERRKWIGLNVSLAYQEPLKIVRGWMQYLYDEEGRRYLDAYNNVPHVGHCHPRVVKAGQDQMAVLNTNTRYLHDLINRYAERLCATLPDPLSVCFFVNSGSEANELALRLARAHTRARDMIVLEHAYHGNTTTLTDISPYKHNGPGGTGAPSWVHTAPIPDLYRGLYRRDDAKAAERYSQYVIEIIEALRESGVGLAGFIAESFPSVAGQIVFPESYLARVYAAVRAAGGVCIADEVQTGYGRVGTHFWAFETYGVVPDIVVLGKPIGNGHPIGAVITTPEIAASFDNGMEFFSTFGGNTVSCAIGLAVLDVVIEEDLQSHALQVGNRMLEGLRQLMDRYSIIGDLRGSGLFLGVELVRNRDTLEPATEEASSIANRMRELGILLGTDGPFHSVIKIRPPMPFSLNDADLLLATMQRILGEDFAHVP